MISGSEEPLIKPSHRRKPVSSRCLAAFVLSVVVACQTAAADTATPEWDLKELMQSLAQVKTAKGKFVELKHLNILSRPLEFSGTLIYTAPGRLEKNTLLPKPESLVLDEDKLTIENKVKNQRRTLVLQDYPVIWAFVESIRSTLAGDLQTLKRFYNVSLAGPVGDWRLTLKPSEPGMQAVVSEIRIRGSGNWVGSVEVIEAEGDRSVMTVVPDAP